MSAGKQVRAGVYGRESQGKQRSIEDQLADGNAEAADIGWDAVAEYQDNVGSSRYTGRERKGWPKLLEDIESGRVDAVIIRDTSRADRKLADWARFLDLCWDKGTLIRSVTKHKTYDCSDFDDYDALVREGLRNVSYAESVRAGSLIGHTKGYEGGRPNGGRVATGYRRSRRIEDGTKIVEQHEDPVVAPMVRKAFADIAAGVPIVTVSAETGWSPSRIRKMIRNVAYIGLRKHNGAVPTKAEWDGLVDEETFYAARNVLAANRAGWRPGSVEHWLSGAITCGCSNVEHRNKHKDGRKVCGMPLVAAPLRGNRELYVYSCPAPGCTSVAALRAESYIRGCMAQTLGDPAFRHRLLAIASTTSKEVAMARAEVERLEHRLREFRRAAATDDSIDPANFAETIREIESERRAATARAESFVLPASLREVEVAAPVGSHRVDPLAGWSEAERQEAIQGMDLFGRWWDKPVAGRRKEVRDTLDIRLLPCGKGQRVPIKERLTVRVRATDTVLTLDVTW